MFRSIPDPRDRDLPAQAGNSRACVHCGNVEDIIGQSGGARRLLIFGLLPRASSRCR